MSLCATYTILVLKIHAKIKTYHDSITAIITRAKYLAERETLAHNSLHIPREGSLRRSDPGKSIKYFLIIKRNIFTVQKLPLFICSPQL